MLIIEYGTTGTLLLHMMLHDLCCHVYAYCAGKVDVIKYIFNEATVQSKSNLLRNANDKQQSRLSVLYDALLMGDTFGGNTPLHLCSQMLASSGNVGSGSEHLRCVNCLLDFIEDRQQRVEQCKSRCVTYTL